MSDQPTPAQQFASGLAAVQSDLSSLQQKSHLSATRDAMGDLDTKLASLPGRIRDLRQRKYVFDKDLDQEAAELASQWALKKPALDGFVTAQEAQFQIALRPLEAQIPYVAGQSSNPTYGLTLLQTLKADLETLESKISGAESAASGMYDELKGQYSALEMHLGEVTWMLDRIDEASFPFQEGEAGICAVKATWARNGREDNDSPQGNLFLTDRRLVFEQNQEVATKKVLFVTTERKRVQQLMLEFPVDVVEDARATHQGMFKNQDFIDLRLGHGGPVPTATFHIWQDGDRWQAAIKKAATHEYDSDRAVALDAGVLEKIKAAPTQCPSCGAAIKQAIPRGALQINCEYCGNVIRI